MTVPFIAITSLYPLHAKPAASTRPGARDRGRPARARPRPRPPGRGRLGDEGNGPADGGRMTVAPAGDGRAGQSVAGKGARAAPATPRTALAATWALICTPP